MIAHPGDDSTMPRRGSSVRGRVLGRPWERGLPLLVLIVDLVAVLLATFVSAQLRFGASRSITLPGAELIDYGTISLTLSAAWVLALSIQGSRDIRILGAGSEEYKRVLQGTLYLFGTFAILAYAAGLDVARGYVGLALPLGVLLLLLGRFLVRGWVARQR
ncbi:sugar transferase, partial [Micrococcus luteus]|nr:sugar transferase [Micrococcus luteus]